MQSGQTDRITHRRLNVSKAYKRLTHETVVGVSNNNNNTYNTVSNQAATIELTLCMVNLRISVS